MFATQILVIVLFINKSKKKSHKKLFNRLDQITEKNRNFPTINSIILNNRDEEQFVFLKTYVKIGKLILHAHVDTLSNISIARYDVIEQIVDEIKIFGGQKPTCANGTQLPVSGIVDDVQIKFNSFEKPIYIRIFVVQNLDFELILGSDFLKMTGAVIDFIQHEVRFTSNAPMRPFLHQEKKFYEHEQKPCPKSKKKNGQFRLFESHEVKKMKITGPTKTGSGHQ